MTIKTSASRTFKLGFNFFNWDHEKIRALDGCLDEMLEHTKATGWEGFETKAGGLQDRAGVLREACGRHGLACAGLGPFTGLRELIDYAQKVGASYVRSQYPKEENARWLDYAGERGVTIVVHPHTGREGRGTGSVETREDLLRYLDERPGLSACPDTGHLMMCGSDPVATIRDLGDRCFCIHLKDIEMHMVEQGARGQSFCDLGDGDLDLDGVLDAVRAINFTGWMIVERDRRVEDYLASARKMRRVLADRGY